MLSLVSVIFSSCRDDEEYVLKARTVIVYMVGDNSLDSYVESDINEMERGWKDSFDGDLLVYVDRSRTSPYILKISSDRTSNIVSREVMKYSEQNSSSLEVMEQVLKDIKSRYPAKSYGLILWSHASGWLPASTSVTRAFGDDSGKSMDIEDLAMLSGKYDFFIFDACDMMGIEAAYELKYNTDYIVASVTQVLAGGFPYDDIMEYLFKKETDLVSVCQAFMKLYRSYTNSEMQTAALSVVKTGNLDNIAVVSRDLIQRYKDNIVNLNLSQIQKYDSDDLTLFFDFYDFMKHLAGNDPSVQTLRESISSAVIFEDHTPSILNLFDIKESCGLSCYIPGQHQGLDNVYRTMEWYKAVYLK
jgi:hypothetical protein